MGNTKCYIYIISVVITLLVFALFSGCTDNSSPGKDSEHSALRTVTDGAGRQVEIPAQVNRVVCSSGGTCTRYLVYLDAADKIVAVESGEQEQKANRAYVLANPQFSTLPVLGSVSGGANLEQIMVINPQVIFTVGSVSNQSSDAYSSAQAMQEKTGIPVIMLKSGSFQDEENRAQLYATFRLLGDVLNKKERAEALIAYIEATLKDLDRRTSDIPESEQKTAFIGGLSHGGAHGFLSTQSEYMPFIWNHITNIAAGSGIQNADFSKEALLVADPDFIFIDAGTLNVVDEISAFEEIKSPVYADMKAVKTGNVYGTLPYTSRMTNLETQLVDAYYIGKVVYPEKFTDIDPNVKADEIYTMFVGLPVFEKLKANCNNLAFEKVPLGTS